MNEIRIKRPKRNEIESINNFFRDVLIDTFKENGIINLEETLIEEIDDKRTCLNQDFETDGKDRFFLIALIEDNIVGTIEYGIPNKLIKDCTNNELEGVLEIGTIFVHPQYQRKGIGNLLLRHILKELIDKGVEEICFDSGYKIAQGIWSKKFGNPQYFLKDYWGEESHHMIWRLKVEAAMKQCV